VCAGQCGAPVACDATPPLSASTMPTADAHASSAMPQTRHKDARGQFVEGCATPSHSCCCASRQNMRPRYLGGVRASVWRVRAVRGARRRRYAAVYAEWRVMRPPPEQKRSACVDSDMVDARCRRCALARYCSSALLKISPRVRFIARFTRATPRWRSPAPLRFRPPRARPL